MEVSFASVKQVLRVGLPGLSGKGAVAPPHDHSARRFAAALRGRLDRSAGRTDKPPKRPTNRRCCSTSDRNKPRAGDRTEAFAYQRRTMAILIIFLLGVGNFALHRAIMESGHPLLGQMPWLGHALSRRLSLGIEFLMLLGGLLLAARGIAWGALGYLGYSLLNAVSAWLILSGRV